MPLLPKTKISPKTATITGKIKGAPRIKTTKLFPQKLCLRSALATGMARIVDSVAE